VNFRRKLLVLFALIILLTVGGVTWVVSVRTRRAFDSADEERTSALVAQFRHEFDRRGEDIVERVQAIAAGDAAMRLAVDLARPEADPSAYVAEAKTLADSHQLEFLELVRADGTIVSSAQSPARVGYAEPMFAQFSALASKGAFLKREELADGGVALGLFAVREQKVGDVALYVIGGQGLDRDFMASLSLPAGMRAILYRNLDANFAPHNFVEQSGMLEEADKLAPLIARVQRTGTDAKQVISWAGDPQSAEMFHAIPLRGENNDLLAVLLVGNSRRTLVELQAHIRSIAFIVGGIAILFAILVSGWLAARVTRPVEQLAEAAREVAGGNWHAQVDVTSHDEVGQLADAFNRMTHELLEQRDRLVQSERVAAWRELARRLAHELKNPLFPLQITVENLVRAREQAPDQFDEVFRESTSTLLGEIANLKNIIGRFSDFSKMPQPQLQPISVNDGAKSALALVQPQLEAPGKPQITAKLELDPVVGTIDADPDLLHRALSNLILNAMDAMPEGGTITVRTRAGEANVIIEVADTGTGLAPEECARLFTPYYTTKRHGTGLGLAIVQSVVSDHRGKVTVESEPGRGATFRIELPRASAAPAPDMFKTAGKIS
jgi:signal transduction histidine kinase